jgi:tRNA-splicing endonuclease subunit Sen54
LRQDFLHNDKDITTMADLDENPLGNPIGNEDDNDPDDEAQDFSLLTSLTSTTGHQIPKRGEKDFESHGTKHQESILAASRQAMHDVLSYTRVHVPKSHKRGFYYGVEGLPRDEAIPEEWRQGLDDDHVVVVESSKGTLFRTMGKSTMGKRYSSMWLLPEEALYMVERGNIDLWWPSRSSFTGVLEEKEGETQSPEVSDEGTPMSLQAAYAMLIGRDGERGKVSLERYTVYTNLKRAGYIVSRAPEWDPTAPRHSHHYQTLPDQAPSLFIRLFGRFFAEEEIKHPAYGPLVKPGLYRSYKPIYHQMSIIPRHKPSPVPKEIESQHPYSVVFELWKPSRIPTFAKSNPGNPDFRIAITDSRSSCLPTLTQFTSLLESTPWDPPNSNWIGPGKTYRRLRHGWRNVILAVVDQGIISYLRIGEAAFGEERVFDRFDRNGQGAKRGGGAGRGRGGIGRGRGRGRGRK